MADTKISGLTALAAADVETDADTLAIVDDSATATKKITVDNLRTAMGPQLDTEQATTSGTEKDFSPPSWAKKITILFDDVSGNGTSIGIIQLGDSGGIEATGYEGAAWTIGASSISSSALSSGFNWTGNDNSSTRTYKGAITLTLEDSSNNTWTASGNTAYSGGAGVAGKKALSGALTTVRVTFVNGTQAFDNGAVNCMYE